MLSYFDIQIKINKKCLKNVKKSTCKGLFYSEGTSELLFLFVCSDVTICLFILVKTR